MLEYSPLNLFLSLQEKNEVVRDEWGEADETEKQSDDIEVYCTLWSCVV